MGSDKHFTTRILVSLALGVLAGLMFGDYCAKLKWVGDAFVGLLQMTVLPYVMFSLMANIGRLTESQGKTLVSVALRVLLILWCIGLATVVFNSLAFPNTPSGSFYSSDFERPQAEADMLKMFVPSNPFSSLANSMIPAVVLFSIGIGVALMQCSNNSELLKQIDVVVEALSRLNKMVIKLSPIGIFAIMANASGTLEFHQFGLLQAYVLVLTLSSLSLSLFLLPLLISSCTPFSYREIMRESTDTLITAFVIGSSFVVLPLIIESTRQLLKRHHIEKTNGVSPPEFIIPLAFPFPDLGRILMLTFIPFSIWFYGSELSLADYPRFLGIGLLGSFGSMNVTIPLLLDEMKLPSDIFQLFLGVGVYTGRLGDVTKAMHLLAFTTVVTCISAGMFKVNWKRFLGVCAIYLIIVTSGALAIQNLMHVTFSKYYNKEQMLTARELLHQPVPFNILEKSEPNPVSLLPDESLLERVMRRGILRIGYDRDEVPFSFYNKNGELVGFDIDVAHRLAHDLEVTLEFVPFEHKSLLQSLREDHFDMAMSGLEGTVKRASLTPLSDSYMDVTLAVMVPDFSKRDFLDLLKYKKGESLTLAVVTDGYFAENALEYFPDANIIEIESEWQYFEDKEGKFDGLITSAETGFAWTLTHPQFTVLNPLKVPVRVPLFYLGSDKIGPERFLNVWLELRKKDGTRQKLYNYWILGDVDESKTPRWCIARDVLEWID